MRIEKTFKYDEKDIIQFGFDTYLYRKGLYMGIIMVIFLLCMLALVLITGSLTQLEIFMMIIFVLILAVMPIMIYFQMKRSYKTSKLLQGEQNFIFEDDGITGKSEAGESKIRWDMFYKFILYRNSLAVYASARQAYIFPRRIFSQVEIEEVKEFLITNEDTKGKTKIYKQ